MNWIEKLSKEVDSQKDRLILENPEAVKELDTMLLTKYLPPLKEHLKNCGFPYSTYDEIPLESEFELKSGLGRKLTVMLFEDTGLSFFRGYISISKSSYLLNREFFLHLIGDTNIDYIQKILLNEKFMGNFPVMHMERDGIMYSEGVPIYCIKIKAGSGFHSGSFSFRQTAIADMKEILTTSIKMFEVSQYGIEDEETLQEFLQLAYKCYESG